MWCFTQVVNLSHLREFPALNIFQIQTPSPAQSALKKLVIIAEINLNVIAPKHVQVKDVHVERLKFAAVAIATQRIHHAAIMKWLKKKLISS